MVYYTDDNGIEFELPAFTVPVAEKLKEAGKPEDIRTKAKKMLEAMLEVLPKEYILGKVGSVADLNDVDLVELTNMFTGVNGAYADAMQRESKRQMREKLAESSETVKSVTDMANAAKFAEVIAGNKGKPGVQAFRPA